jgi:cephalosporin-C deacetylase-like acetyl esterase
MRRLAVLLFLATAASTIAQDKAKNPLPDPQRELYDHLVRRAQEHFDARRKEVASLKTPEEIQKRQQTLKAKFIESIGGFPEKTPLNAKVTGTLQADGFRVEKVIYESRPNHHVTANLYLPDAKGPVPGVLLPCGHSANGKAADAYQRAAILMAKNGLAVLCYDPIGQGERLQLLKDDGKPGIAGSTTEHTLIGIGAWLTGQSVAGYRIWDGIRSLDYLASRPEVDAKRLGCTGNSGGGTLTSYLMALDDRIVCAAPSCYITTMEKLLVTLGPQDAEQNIVGQIAFGMEHADYLTMRAPKPTLMCVATQDFFNIDGAWTSFREAKLLYGKLGHGERVSLFEFDDKHGFSKPRREAAMRWMRRWLLGIDDAPVEGDFASFKDEQLQCTRSGQVLADLGGVSAFQLSVQAAEQGREARDAFVNLAVHKRRTIVFDLLKIDTASREASPPAVNVLTITLPEHPGSKESDLFIERYHGLRGSLLIFSGLGGSSTRSSSIGPEFKTAQLSLLLDRPLLGQRVDFLLRHAAREKSRCRVVAQGCTGPVALHFAALSDLATEVTIEGGLVSWENVVRTPLSVNQISNVVPSVLKHYDLPQLAATLAPRPLTLRNMVDAAGRPLAVKDVEAIYRPCREAYERAGASAKFRIE